jgi:hypothetical protein
MAIRAEAELGRDQREESPLVARVFPVHTQPCDAFGLVWL